MSCVYGLPITDTVADTGSSTSCYNSTGLKLICQELKPRNEVDASDGVNSDEADASSEPDIVQLTELNVPRFHKPSQYTA